MVLRATLSRCSVSEICLLDLVDADVVRPTGAVCFFLLAVVSSAEVGLFLPSLMVDMLEVSSRADLSSSMGTAA